MASEHMQREQEDSSELRIIFVEKTGVDKSAAGNTILGKEAFKSELSSSSVASECQTAKAQLNGRTMTVIDTPGASLINGAKEPLRLVLVGLRGAGKSASGNTILGSKEFQSDISSISVTLQSESREGLVCERSVIVVDTPALFNTELSDQKMKHEIEKALTLCHPGPHVFLVVIQLGRFTEQESRIMEELSEVLGPNVNLNYMVLFTYGDKLNDKTIDQFVKEDTHLQTLIKKCGGCYHVFNNTDPENEAQVRELLEKIDNQIKNREKQPCFVKCIKKYMYLWEKIIIALFVVILLALKVLMPALMVNKRRLPAGAIRTVMTDEATEKPSEFVPDQPQEVLEKSTTIWEMLVNNNGELIPIALGIGAGLWILRQLYK